MDIYTVVFLITTFILVITAVDVKTSRLVRPKNKRNTIAVCIFIFIASLCEYIGEKLNGAATDFVLLHRIVKLMEFCASPCISIAAANAYGKLIHKKIAASVLVLHTIFEIAAFFNGWVFLVDSQNVYHREKLYWVYVVTFILSIFSGYVCIIRRNRKYQAQLGLTSVVILFFLAFVIVIQLAYSGVAMDFMCVAMGSFFLYHHCGNIVNQIDITTRLLNRRCFERNIENIKAPACVLFFDINKFKIINDTYGHNEGDKCLENVGKIILSIYGKYGFCYRIGGDEFCVIMYKGLNKIQTLNRCFNDSVEEVRLNNGKIFGVSLGYAYYDGKELTIDDVIKKADEMMYKNKMK